MRRKVCHISVATLTYWGEGAGKCCWASVRWYFISQTPDPVTSQIREKNKMRQAKDHFGHYFLFSWGMCEAIPGSPPTNQNNKTTKSRSIQSSEQKGRRKKRKPMIILFVLAQTTLWCNRFSSDVVSAWKKLKATHYYYSHARPYQLK